MRIGDTLPLTIETGSKDFITLISLGRRYLRISFSPDPPSTGIKPSARTSTPLIKYTSKAAYKLMNSCFLLCRICSPSNNVL